MMNDIVMEFYEVLRERDRKAQAEKIALAVIALGKMSHEEIAEAVGLTLAEVEELAKEKSV